MKKNTTVGELRVLCREAHAALRDIAEVASGRGCSCECGHDQEGHDDECERCDMCLIGECVSTRLMDRLRTAGGG